MKYLKKIILFVVLFVMVSNFTYSQMADGKYIDENVAIIDVSTIDVGKNMVASVITLKDFNGSKSLPEGFSLNGYTFMDNGNFNDRKANDGHYTSKETKVNSNLKNNSKLNTVFTTSSFQYQNELNYQYRGIGCSFERCGCPSSCGSCPACDWYGWDCWRVKECELILF
jgi:hypothetical protein